MPKRLSLCVIVGFLVFTGCRTMKTPSAPAEVMTLENLPAADQTTYVSLRDHRVIPDSARTLTNWDLALEGTNISVNGEGVLVEVAFDSLQVAPKEGYRRDGGSQGNVVPGGSGNGWYLYDPEFHVLEPIPDRTLVVRTLDGTYAKVAVQSYYHLETDAPRFYTLRYAHQASGDSRF